MKSIIKKFAVLVILLTSCVIYPRQTLAQESNVSFQVFYDQLSPYGEWVNDEHYGYVWFPDVSADFVPYSTDGRWILSDYGWTWASDYDWGWAAFHYGRWSLNDSYGWFWIPDNEWGPAWVNWRQADGYYGWSPMEPGMSPSMNYDRDYDNYNRNWMFVRDRDLERSNIHDYYIDRSEQNRIGRNSIVIKNSYHDNSRHTTYVSGPSRVEVQRVVGRTIRPVVISENNKPGQVITNGQIRIYRPQISTNGRKPVPTRVSNMNEIRHSQGNGTSTQPRKVTPANDNPVRQPYTGDQQLNNGVPAQRRDDNQRNNNQYQPSRTPVPSNPGSNAPATQPQRTYPTNTDRQVRPNTNQQPAEQRNVTPQNNTVQPNQQQNSNSQNKTDHPDRQRYVAPQNNTVQPNQQRNMTPQNGTVQPNQQRNVVPQNNTVQPNQQRNVAPQNNTVQPNQQRNVAPQNNTVQPNQQRNVAPQNNTVQPNQQRNVAPQNNAVQPDQQRNVRPQNNNVQPNQQRNANPQNNNSMQQNNNSQGQRQSAPGNVQNNPQPNQPTRGNQPAIKGSRQPQKEVRPQKQVEKPVEVKPENK